MEEWLKKELKFLVDDFLSEAVIRKYDIVNYEYVKDLKADFLSGKKSYLYSRLWNLIVLHKWLLKNEA